MADLVAHRRVEEAVRAMFGELRGLPAAQRAIAAEARARTTGAQPAALRSRSSSQAVVGAVVVLALLIRWRVCPRCAGLLRARALTLPGRSVLQTAYTPVVGADTDADARERVRETPVGSVLSAGGKSGLRRAGH